MSLFTLNAQFSMDVCLHRDLVFFKCTLSVVCFTTIVVDFRKKRQPYVSTQKVWMGGERRFGIYLFTDF